MTAITAGFFFYSSMSWFQVAALSAALSWCGFITATIVHNIVHVPMTTSPRLNRWIQLAISSIYGNSVSVFVRGHNYSHHRHVQTPKDLMRTTKARFRWNFLNQALFVFIVGPAIERGNKVYIAREKEADTPWYRQFVIERRVVIISSVILLIAHFPAAFFFGAIPRIFGIWAIVGINFIQHDGCDETHPFNHSRNLVGPIMNWWTFNNGYHTAHHHDPGLHWTQLPAAHANDVVPHIHAALNQANMFTYIFRSTIYPGRRVTYEGHPYSPPPCGEDEDWIPRTIEMPEGVSAGAAGRSYAAARRDPSPARADLTSAP